MSGDFDPRSFVLVYVIKQSPHVLPRRERTQSTRKASAPGWLPRRRAATTLKVPL